MENSSIAVKPKIIFMYIYEFLVQQSAIEKDLNKLKNIYEKYMGNSSITAKPKIIFMQNNKFLVQKPDVEKKIKQTKKYLRKNVWQILRL